MIEMKAIDKKTSYRVGQVNTSSVQLSGALRGSRQWVGDVKRGKEEGNMASNEIADLEEQIRELMEKLEDGGANLLD